MRVGFIGVGIMGSPMVRNLLKAGHEVTIYARHPEKKEVQAALAAGAHAAPSSRAVAMASEIVITMVTSSAQVEEVVAGPQGILDGAREGLIVIDMSTIAPSVSRKLYELCASRSVAFLDAPVSGGSIGAEQGTLAIMVGGDQQVFEQVRPVLEAMGRKEAISYIGASGSGEVVKLVNNLLVGAIQSASIEALVLGKKAGLDPKTMLDVIMASSGASFQLGTYMTRRGLIGDFEPGFTTDLLHKDLGLALDLATEHETPLTMVEQARKLYEESQAAGNGSKDSTALLEVYEQKTGVEVRLQQ